MPEEMDKYFEAYLEEKFKGISENIGHLRSQQEGMSKKVDTLVTTIDAIKTAEQLHFFDCPNTEEVSEMKDRLGKLWEIRVNWKVYALATVAVLVILVASGIGGYEALREKVIPQVKSNTKRVDDLESRQNKEDAKEYFENGSKTNPGHAK